MALLSSMVMGVGLGIAQEGMVMLLLCMLVMALLVVVGLILGFAWLVIWLLKSFDKKPEQQTSDTLGSSLAQGREVDIRHQADNPLQRSEENQSQPDKEQD